MYSLELGRQLFTGPTPRGPWRLDQPVKPVTEARQHPKRKRRKPTMSTRPSNPAPQLSEEDKIIMMEGWPHLQQAAARRRQELAEEKQRRRVHEQTQPVGLDLDPDEIRALCQGLEEWLLQGRPEGAPLMPRDLHAHLDEILATMTSDPPADGEEDVTTTEGFRGALLGSGCPGKGRRREEFLEQLRDAHIVGEVPWM
jgi:hypothetical protein